MAEQFVKQHVVPKRYLQRFAQLGKKDRRYIIGVRRASEGHVNMFLRSISDVAYIRNLYDDDRLEDPKHWEHMFAEEYEPLYGDAVERIISRTMLTVDGVRILSEEDKMLIGKLIAIQFIRVPDFLERYQKTGEQIGADIARDVYRRYRGKLSSEKKAVIDKLCLNGKSIRSILLTVLTDSERIEWFAKVIAGNVMNVIYNRTPIPFCTSDNPVILYNVMADSFKYGDGGLARSDTLVLYPLSSTVMIQVCYRALFNDKDMEYDVLLAGFPCQAFSRVGLRKGFRDSTRGTIFFDIADIIQRTQPKAVFLENVEGLLYHDKGHTMRTIINTLETELGYRVIGVTMSDDGEYEYSSDSFVRNTKKFGLPQNRPRAYIMAFNKNTYSKRAFKLLHAQLPTESDDTIYEDVNAVLEPVVDDKFYMAEGYLETLKRHKERQESRDYGFGYCVVNENNSAKPYANTLLATGGSGKERNLIRQYKEGVAGKIIGEKKTPLNSENIRVMTPIEWGRLQGFIGYGFIEDGVDTFHFPEGITDTQKYKQFGNSVSIPVIKSMAEYMLKCFDKLEHYQDIIIKAEALERPYLSVRNVMEALDVTKKVALDVLERMINKCELMKIMRGNRIRYTLYPEDVSHACLPPFNQREAILDFAEKRETFTNDDALVLLNATKNSVHVLLSTLVKEGRLVRIKRGVYSVRHYDWGC